MDRFSSGIQLPHSLATTGETRQPDSGAFAHVAMRRGQLIATFFGGGEAVIGTPVGALSAWMTGAAPKGWLLCIGGTVSRSTYQWLFEWANTNSLITGATHLFGAGDGSTTFRLPNLNGLAFTGSGGSISLGSSIGAASHNLAHNHGGNTGNAGSVAVSGLLPGETAAPANHNHTISSNLGTIDNRPPSLAGNWIIYAGAQ